MVATTQKLEKKLIHSQKLKHLKHKKATSLIVKSMNKILLNLTLSSLLSLVNAQFLPGPQLCNPTNVTGAAQGRVEGHGHFSLILDISCDPDNKDTAFPQGSLSLSVETNDPQFKGDLVATVIEGARTIGHVAPMAIISGQCELKNVRGCRFWLFMADNDHDKAGTADIISFLILDASGREIAYASAPAESSSLSIKSER